jgi:hypothetical protein
MFHASPQRGNATNNAKAMAQDLSCNEPPSSPTLPPISTGRAVDGRQRQTNTCIDRRTAYLGARHYDALAKLMIQKGIVSQQRLVTKISEERAMY